MALLRRTALFLACAVLCGLMVNASTTFAANKVKTQKIIVPEEKSSDGHDHSNEDTSSASPLEIPVDALPSLDPKDPTEKTAEEERNLPPPPVLRDVSALPEPVRNMRSLILEAAKSGKIENLRKLIGSGDEATSLSIGGLVGDPIEFLKESSGDDHGYEILAILIEVLEAGYVHMDKGTDNELFVWPYYFAWPLDKLSPQQTVEMYRLLTAGDVEDSHNFGGYIFYRVGIRPNGRWSFFVAGD